MNKRKQQGFTIIEVVLVLAIAGLIFLMVFLALPALQRSQRDVARRNSLSTFTAQITQYQANNKGEVPPTDSMTGTRGFIAKYMGSNWIDPTSNVAYELAADDASVDDATTPGTYFYTAGKTCDREALANGGGRNFAVRMKLEGSGVACMSN